CEDTGAMEDIVSDGLRLPARFAQPSRSAARVPALLLLPGFPRGTGGAAMAGHTHPSLADRIAREAGCAALTSQSRGHGRAAGGAAARIPPGPWLLVHGTEGDGVPIGHARRLAAAADHGVEVREVQEGAHRLRHDPRAIAMFLGWLDRHS